MAALASATIEIRPSAQLVEHIDKLVAAIRQTPGDKDARINELEKEAAELRHVLEKDREAGLAALRRVHLLDTELLDRKRLHEVAGNAWAKAVDQLNARIKELEGQEEFQSLRIAQLETRLAKSGKSDAELDRLRKAFHRLECLLIPDNGVKLEDVRRHVIETLWQEMPKEPTDAPAVYPIDPSVLSPEAMREAQSAMHAAQCTPPNDCAAVKVDPVRLAEGLVAARDNGFRDAVKANLGIDLDRLLPRPPGNAARHASASVEVPISE